MNRADRMLECLSSPTKEWWTRSELFAHRGRFYLTNNAASELRERGYEVQQRYHEGNVEYRLLDQGHEDNGARDDSSPSARPVAVPLIEQTDGQLALAPVANTYEWDSAA